MLNNPTDNREEHTHIQEYPGMGRFMEGGDGISGTSRSIFCSSLVDMGHRPSPSWRKMNALAISARAFLIRFWRRARLNGSIR
jgi:hypothetical protein